MLLAVLVCPSKQGCMKCRHQHSCIHTHQMYNYWAMLCRWMSIESWHHTSLLVNQWGWISYPLWLRHWELCQRTSSLPFLSLCSGRPQKIDPQDSTTCTKQLFHKVAIALILWGNVVLWLYCQPTPPLCGLFSVVLTNVCICYNQSCMV